MRGALVALALGAVGLSAGCPDNQAACNVYYSKLQSERLACGIQDNDEVDPLPAQETVCPPSLSNGADCTDHYLSLSEQVSCDEATDTIVYLAGDGGTAPGTTLGCF